MDRSATASSDQPPPGGAPVALYIHVPFCVSLCPYCDFVVVAGAAARGARSRIATYVAAVRTELTLRADALDARFGPPGAPDRPPLASVYLGGGTPSLLPADEIAGLLSLARELRATDVTDLSSPVHRRATGGAPPRRGGGSFGAQSPAQNSCAWQSRPADVAEAVVAAHRAGIQSVNVDLLYDVPGQSLASWIDTLETVLEFGPDHLSLYALTLDDPDAEGLTGPTGDHLPTSPGARRWRDIAGPEQDDDRAAAEYHYAVHRLGDEGWRGYEISNWARPGHECRHNLAYWERRPYEAVGPGAHAFDGAVRRWNGARLDTYLAALTPPTGEVPHLPPGGEQALDAATARAEELILGLRTDGGIPLDAMARDPFASVFGWALANELVAMDRERIRLTTRGRLLSNEVFARLV
jgi:oxygen-independent coproporphyrinogen-3 oxidase